MWRGPMLTFLAVLLYGFFHSFMASPWVKAQVQRWLGEGAQRGYRLFYNVTGALTFLPVLALVAYEPGPVLYRIASPWLYLTTLGQALAVVVVLVGLLQTDVWRFLGLRQLLGETRKAENGLVVKGLYRCVRHPLYSAGLFFIWLTPIMTLSVLVMNLGLTLYIYVGTFFEERRLVAHFGQAYERYQQHVPRLIPCRGVWRELR